MRGIDQLTRTRHGRQSRRRRRGSSSWSCACSQHRTPGSDPDTTRDVLRTRPFCAVVKCLMCCHICSLKNLYSSLMPFLLSYTCPIHLVEVDGVSELEPLAVLLTSRQLGQQPPHLQHIIHIHKSQVTNLSRKLHLSPHSGPELVPWSPLVHCRGHGQASAVTIDRLVDHDHDRR